MPRALKKFVFGIIFFGGFFCQGQERLAFPDERAPPSDFMLTIDTPRVNRVKIHISSEKKDGTDFIISYSKSGKYQTGQKSRKFSATVIAKLFKELWSSTPPYDLWPTDVVCGDMQRWRIRMNEKTRQICRNGKIEDALLKFQNCVSLIFRD